MGVCFMEVGFWEVGLRWRPWVLEGVENFPC